MTRYFPAILAQTLEALGRCVYLMAVYLNKSLVQLFSLVVVPLTSTSSAQELTTAPSWSFQTPFNTIALPVGTLDFTSPLLVPDRPPDGQLLLTCFEAHADA